jgi:hypothetical protein
MRRSIAVTGCLSCLVAAVVVVVGFAAVVWRSYEPGQDGARHTVATRLDSIGPVARERLAPRFEAAGVAYPPRHLTLVGLKSEKRLLVYAGDAADALKLVHSYKIRRASGGVGPKLKEGDRQVPEGIYGIDLLNPNSRYRVSVRIDYPNAADKRQARREGRSDLGGWIMIHGGASSIGCLAMGDPASEEIFTLVADTGAKKVRVILTPVDMRRRRLPKRARKQPKWVQARYARISEALAALPAAP